MSVTTHERPGVYSSYDASRAIHGGSGARVVGLAAACSTADDGVYLITSYEQALQTFGVSGEQGMAGLIRVALQNGAAAVAAVPVADGDYETAFARLDDREDVAVLICDSTTLSVQQAMLEAAESASAARRERICVAAGAAQETSSALITRAAGLNSERAVLVGPWGVSSAGAAQAGLSLAAAVAGSIAGMDDPAIPLGGAELSGVTGLGTQYTDGDIDLLVRGGVTPLESVAGVVSVVRGVTTRTTTDSVADASWRDLSTILIVDDVIPAVRRALRARFRRVKNTAQGRGAIRSQVVLELENKISREIITGYEGLSVTADPEEPTRCLVEFSFTVAHGLNQIWLTAHITI